MPASTGMTTANFMAYIIFMVISLPVVYVRPHKLQYLFYGSSAIVIIFEIVVLIWSLATMGDAGFGDTMSGKGTDSSGWNIAFGIISTIGSIAAGILNQNDYARFARKPRDAVYGQVFSFPIYAIVCSVIGILVTAATQNRYGEAYWNLPTLLGAIIEHGGSRSRAAAFFGGAALVISQIGVNVPGNALSGGLFDFLPSLPQWCLSLTMGFSLYRIRSSGDIPQIRQYPPRSIPDCTSFHCMQPVETGEYGNDLPGSSEQLLCVFGTDDRTHDFIVLNCESTKDQSGGPVCGKYG